MKRFWRITFSGNNSLIALLYNLAGFTSHDDAKWLSNTAHVHIWSYSSAWGSNQKLLLIFHDNEPNVLFIL